MINADTNLATPKVGLWILKHGKCTVTSVPRMIMTKLIKILNQADAKAPWILRLLAVIMILTISMVII